MLAKKSKRRKNNFATRVRHRLLDLRMSVTDLAAKLDRPRQTVSGALYTNKFPKLSRKIAELMKVDL